MLNITKRENLYWRVNQQETKINNIMRCNKNQPSNLGSSETIREAPQLIELSDYESFGKPDHIKKIDRSFLEWFIGFSEGDASFVKDQLAFVINQKDPKLLFRIKKN